MYIEVNTELHCKCRAHGGRRRPGPLKTQQQKKKDGMTMMSDMFLKMVSSGDADKEGGELAAQAEAAPLRGVGCVGGEPPGGARCSGMAAQRPSGLLATGRSQ